MRVTQPFRTTEGGEYLVLIESFTKSTLPDDITTELEDIDIANIVLERVSGECITSPHILFDISNYIAGFLLDNEKTILYFYCDDMNSGGLTASAAGIGAAIFASLVAGLCCKPKEK